MRVSRIFRPLPLLGILKSRPERASESVRRTWKSPDRVGTYYSVASDWEAKRS